MDAPIFVYQVSPRTVHQTGAVKATAGLPLEFLFDLIGEPKLPRRALFAVVPAADALGARSPAELESAEWTQLDELGNDRYRATWTPRTPGEYVPVVVAWMDEVGRLADLAGRKLVIGESCELELADIAALLRTQARDDAVANFPAFGHALRPSADRAGARSRELARLADLLDDSQLQPGARLGALESSEAEELARLPLRAELATFARGQEIRCEDRLAAVGAWYELFPRSFGGFKGVKAQLSRLASLGFDVIYLPPIHPVGVTKRKGRNNSLAAGPGDVGSPWAIGSSEGGHTAIDPGLGSAEDFAELVSAARGLGIEIALDIAFQCSPDHPWVAQHPAWFNRRADGSIAYAENPPKKYQDVYPVNFQPEREEDRTALWEAAYQVFEHWLAAGVRIFRVDNPHTKPLPFWEWACGRLRREHPEAILLAEAFTMPKLMYHLGEIGFSQSYTYFTWRVAKWELEAYGAELASPEAVATMRPNFWTNTPDILADPLRNGPLSAFALRATLAATMAPSWGVYSGFEFGENQPITPDSEEYMDSEKYQLRQRDFSAPAPLDSYIATLNSFRRAHPAIANQAGFEAVGCDNPELIAYLRTEPGGDAVLVVVNLSPHHAREGTIDLGPVRRAFASGPTLRVHDRVSGATFTWEGERAYVRLDPVAQVAHLLEPERRNRVDEGDINETASSWSMPAAPGHVAS